MSVLAASRLPAGAARHRAPRYRPTLFDVLLALWCGGWFVVDLVTGGASWHFFVKGAYALSHPDHPVWGGLHVYAGLPVLQIGPVALLLAGVFRVWGVHASLVLAQVFGAAAGVAVVVVALRIARAVRPEAELGRRARWGLFFFAPVWLYLAVSSVHLDDVLAMLFGLLAVLATLRGRPVTVGVFAGLAADSKPWALPFIALALALPGTREKAKAVAACLVTVLAAWLPFFLADPNTMNAARFTIVNRATSGLHALGVTTPRTPRWDRPLQAVVGLAVAWIAVRKGRWLAVLMLVVAARMVLDPGTNYYYSAGLVAGAFLWDVAGSTWRWPWWTASAAVGLYALRYLSLPPAINGWILVAFFAAAVGLLALRSPTRTVRSVSP